MKASEIFGKELKELLACYDLTKINDMELAKAIISLHTDVETRHWRDKSDFLHVMYGDEDRDERDRLDDEKTKAEIEKLRAQAFRIRLSPDEQ